jgi:iron complex outermembrane receptor protein
MKPFKRNTIACSLAHATFAQFILLGSGAVLAQQADTAAPASAAAQADTGQMDRIVVTATRRNTFVQETPLAVTAFNQDTLQNNQVKDLASLATMVPSLVVEQHGDSGGVHVYMRGVGSANHTELGDPAVAFYVDGVYSPRPQAPRR